MYAGVPHDLPRPGQVRIPSGQPGNPEVRDQGRHDPGKRPAAHEGRDHVVESIGLADIEDRDHVGAGTLGRGPGQEGSSHPTPPHHTDYLVSGGQGGRSPCQEAVTL